MSDPPAHSQSQSVRHQHAVVRSTEVNNPLAIMSPCLHEEIIIINNRVVSLNCYKYAVAVCQCCPAVVISFIPNWYKEVNSSGENQLIWRKSTQLKKINSTEEINSNVKSFFDLSTGVASSVLICSFYHVGPRWWIMLSCASVHIGESSSGLRVCVPCHSMLVD